MEIVVICKYKNFMLATFNRLFNPPIILSNLPQQQDNLETKN